MFLTEKRYGFIKAHTCADGRKQWEYIEKVYTASPIAMLESIFITATIDAKEEQDVGIIYFPGAFLHAENDETVVMLMKRKMAELMVHVALQIYQKYITTAQRGEIFLYMKVLKALYGTLKSAL